MAAAKNTIANRVQAHKQQAKGMLTPGLGTAARGESGRPLPSIFTHFSVGKAKEASSKMRFLDHRRMGKMQAETSKTFSQAIPQKFEEVQKLLHINPRVSREETIWNEMEKTLPIQASAQQYEEPAQPGELRAGSVIQKFSIMPKDGQSIGSFKEQTRSLTKPKSVQRTASQKPKVDPKARLFSQVQEVSSSQQKPAADMEQRPPVPPATVKRDTVQRQVDTVPPPPKQTSVSPPLPSAEQTEKTHVAENAQTNADMLKLLSAAMDGQAKPPKQVAEEQAPKISPPSELPLKKDIRLAQPKPSQKADVPVQKAPTLVQAKPVTKKPEAKKEAARPLAKALPVAKPTAPTVQRKVDVPTAKPSVKVLQPKPQETAPASLPKIKPEVPRAAQPEKTKQAEALTQSPAEKKAFVPPRDESLQPESTRQIPPPVKTEPAKAAPPSEMPLHRKIQARREAPKVIKTLRPETVKPAESKPLLAPLQRPIISRQKYSRSEPPAVPADEPALQQSQRAVSQAPVAEKPIPAADMPAEFAALDDMLSARTGQPKVVPSAPRAAAPVHDSRQRLPMALAKAPRIVQTLPKVSEKQEELVKNLRTELTQSKEREQEREEERSRQEPALPIPGGRLTSSTSVSRKNVIQRQPDDDTSESVSSQQEPELDLGQLAEDVLPYVKRILEIESERIPGSLH